MLSPSAGARTVLVTGGCGYLGSQLIRDLATDQQLNIGTIRILDNLQSGNYQALMDLPQNGRFELFEGDILDPAALHLALSGVDTVIHLAAVVRTPLGYDHPVWTEQVNHWGTARLIEACLDAGVGRFLYASSAAVYGPGGPFTESDSCRPVGAYAQSKERAEKSVRSGGNRGLRFTILRLGTLFGVAPAMRFDAVANRFAYLVGIGRALPIYGSGRQERPLLHVRDASAATRLCLARTFEGETINVVGQNVSIHELVNAVRAVVPEVKVHYTDQDILGHYSFVIEAERLLAAGWSPQVGLEMGLAEVVDRFRSLHSTPIAAPSDMAALETLDE